MLPAGTRCPASAAASSNSPPARSKPCMTESSQILEHRPSTPNERPGLFSRLLGDEYELEGACFGLIVADVGVHPVDADTARLGQPPALVQPGGGKSTAVTCQPREASHTALRPSPAATSSARPGARSCSSATANRFGSAVHTSPVPA